MIDSEADDQDWVIDWVCQDLTAGEKELLWALASRIIQSQPVVQ